MIDKDKKKIGTLDYTDFAKWFGNAFSSSGGFYFRQNGCMNPEQNYWLLK
jgi:hypothetical protein